MDTCLYMLTRTAALKRTHTHHFDHYIPSISGRLISYSIPIHPDASITVSFVNITSYLSVLDLIMCTCQITSVQAHHVWNELPEVELDGTMILFSGQHTMITLIGALKLLKLLLYGDCEVRDRVEAMITHYVTRISEAQVTSQVVAPLKEPMSSIPFDDFVPQ